MRASLKTLVIMGTALLGGCSITMTPPGQNPAAQTATPQVETVVKRKWFQSWNVGVRSGNRLRRN